jgi:hypothetical protein
VEEGLGVGVPNTPILPPSYEVLRSQSSSGQENVGYGSSVLGSIAATSSALKNLLGGILYPICMLRNFSHQRGRELSRIPEQLQEHLRIRELRGADISQMREPFQEHMRRGEDRLAYAVISRMLAEHRDMLTHSAEHLSMLRHSVERQQAVPSFLLWAEGVRQ